MGMKSRINQAAKYALRQTRMGKLVNEIERLHATQPLAPWQRDRIREIRNICEAKEKKLFEKANQLCQELREEHMQFEIDFIYASGKFRQDHPGEEMDLEPKGFVATLKKSFDDMLTSSSKILFNPDKIENGKENN